MDKIKFAEIIKIESYFEFFHIDEEVLNKIKNIMNEWKPIDSVPKSVLNFKLKNATKIYELNELLHIIEHEVKSDYDSWAEMIVKKEVKLKYFLSSHIMAEQFLFIFAQVDRMIDNEKKGSVIYNIPLIKTKNEFYIWSFTELK
jgi:hypothetical protein